METALLIFDTKLFGVNNDARIQRNMTQEIHFETMKLENAQLSRLNAARTKYRNYWFTSRSVEKDLS